MDALVVNHLYKRFSRSEVLNDINMRIEKGKIVALLGPNGAGKSTLMKIILGIYKPTRGSVRVFGKEPISARKFIGYCPQEGGLRDELTGVENLSFFAGLYGLKGREAKRYIYDILERIGISIPLKEQVKKYSGGMKKILSFILSMIHDPELLILDEPTAPLDPSVRVRFWKFIENLRGKKTVLFASHNVEEAEKFADHVYILYKGKIIAEGTPRELIKKYAPKGAIEIEMLNAENIIVNELCKLFPCNINKSVIRIASYEPDEDVPKIVTKIYEMGGKVKSLRVVRPSLEDVFLKVMKGWD